MKLSQKIKEIRLQPEHVRMRYVWGSVIVSMLIILAIWIFSIGAMFSNHKNEPVQEGDGSTDIAKQLQDLKQQAPSLKDYANEPINISSEGVSRPQSDTNSANFQFPATPTTPKSSDTPQANSYSDLPSITPVR